MGLPYDASGTTKGLTLSLAGQASGRRDVDRRMGSSPGPGVGVGQG